MEKGSAQAKKATEDLNKSLTATDAISTKVGEKFTNLVKQASGAVLAFLSVGAIVGGIKAAADYNLQLARTSKELNINVETLDAWSTAVKKSGGTAEGFQQTVKTMNAALFDISQKGTSGSLFMPLRELGIRILDSKGKIRSFISLLPEIAGAFEHMSKAKSADLGKRLGLDQGTINLLQQGRREVDAVIARQKELGVATKKDTETALKFNEQWEDTAHVFRSVFTSVGTSVLPILTKLLQYIEKGAQYFRDHSDLIVGGIIAIGAAITVALLPAIASAVVAFSPFLTIGAVIAGIGAAFALIYEDIQAFRKGNDSLLGELIKKWPIVGEIFKFIVGEVKGTIAILQSLGKFIIDYWEGIISVIKSVVDGIMSAIDKIAGAYNKVKSFLGFGNGNTQVNVAAAQQALATANNSPINSQTSNSLSFANQTSNRSTSISAGPINIHTQATDAKGISKDIGGGLNRQMRQVANDLDDGVAA